MEKEPKSEKEAREKGTFGNGQLNNRAHILIL